MSYESFLYTNRPWTYFYVYYEHFLLCFVYVKSFQIYVEARKIYVGEKGTPVENSRF